MILEALGVATAVAGAVAAYMKFKNTKETNRPGDEKKAEVNQAREEYEQNQAAINSRLPRNRGLSGPDSPNGSNRNK